MGWIFMIFSCLITLLQTNTAMEFHHVMLMVFARKDGDFHGLCQFQGEYCSAQKIHYEGNCLLNRYPITSTGQYQDPVRQRINSSWGFWNPWKPGEIYETLPLKQKTMDIIPYQLLRQLFLAKLPTHLDDLKGRWSNANLLIQPAPFFSPSGIRTKARRTSNKAWRIRYSPSSGRVLSTQNAVFWLFYLPAMFLVWQQHAFLRLPLPSTRYRNV